MTNEEKRIAEEEYQIYLECTAAMTPGAEGNLDVEHLRRLSEKAKGADRIKTEYLKGKAATKTQTIIKAKDAKRVAELGDEIKPDLRSKKLDAISKSEIVEAMIERMEQGVETEEKVPGFGTI